MTLTQPDAYHGADTPCLSYIYAYIGVVSWVIGSPQSQTGRVWVVMGRPFSNDSRPVLRSVAEEMNVPMQILDRSKAKRGPWDFDFLEVETGPNRGRMTWKDDARKRPCGRWE